MNRPVYAFIRPERAAILEADVHLMQEDWWGSIFDSSAGLVLDFQGGYVRNLLIHAAENEGLAQRIYLNRLYADRFTPYNPLETFADLVGTDLLESALERMTCLLAGEASQDEVQAGACLRQCLLQIGSGLAGCLQGLCFSGEKCSRRLVRLRCAVARSPYRQILSGNAVFLKPADILAQKAIYVLDAAWGRPGYGIMSLRCADELHYSEEMIALLAGLLLLDFSLHLALMGRERILPGTPLTLVINGFERLFPIFGGNWITELSSLGAKGYLFLEGEDRSHYLDRLSLYGHRISNPVDWNRMQATGYQPPGSWMDYTMALF
jgi:hypothetical protein